MIEDGPSNVKFVRLPAKAAKTRKEVSKGDAAIVFRLFVSLGIAWVLPRKWWPSLARHTSRLGAFLAGKTTAAVASRMARALGDNSGETSARLASDLHAARYEVAFQCLRGYRPGGWHPKITVHGGERIGEALKLGKGCVLWVAHFVFAPNVAKVGLSRLGYRVSHLSRPDHGFSSTRFGIRTLNRVRSGFEDRYLAERITFDRAHPASALMRARKTVAKNGIVSFTAGAWEGSSVVEADFLGSRIALALGPVWLARTSGAVLLPVFAMRTGGADEFVVEVGEPIDVPAALPESECMEQAARTFLQRHVPHMRKYPGQWRAWSSLHDPGTKPQS